MIDIGNLPWRQGAHGGGARGIGHLDHPAMYLSALEAGSLVLDVDGLTMSVKFLRETGVVRDEFTIVKGGSGQPGFEIIEHRHEDGSLTLTWKKVS